VTAMISWPREKITAVRRTPMFQKKLYDGLPFPVLMVVMMVVQLFALNAFI
jgi:hypothetical protein